MTTGVPAGLEMTAPRCGEARRQPGSGQAKQTTRAAKIATGRPAYQGKSAPSRKHDQAPPTWAAPKGADAADDLAAAFATWPR